MTDASYVTKDDSLSQLAFAFFLNYNSGTIYARSFRDKTVSHSSTETEIKSIDEAIRQSVWLRGFLEELGYPQLGPTIIYTDSNSSILMSKTLRDSPSSSHLVMRINYIHQEIKNGNVKLIYIDGGDNTADVLTKPLAAAPHTKHAQNLLQGFDGIAPNERLLVTPEQLAKRQITKMRAAKRRLMNARAK